MYGIFVTASEVDKDSTHSSPTYWLLILGINPKFCITVY